MRKINEVMEEPVNVKRGTLFLWGVGGFGCGCVFMFFVVLLAVI